MPDRTQTLSMEIDAAFAQVLASGDETLYTPGDLSVARKEFAAAVEKARTALSRSEHQDQERCGGREFVIGNDGTSHGVALNCPGCPDRNPAPTQVEGDEKLSPDLEALAAAAVEVEAFEDARLSDLACLLLNLWGDGWKVVRATPGQPEGGDEGDWKRTVALAVCREVSGLSPEITDDIGDVERALAPFVPATSQDSSGLQKAREEGEEAASARLYAFFDDDEYPEAQLRSRLAFAEVRANRAERAETALEELRKKFEQRADESRRLRDDLKVGSTGYAIADACAVEWEKAGTAAREKAAKLKEGKQ